MRRYNLKKGSQRQQQANTGGGISKALPTAFSMPSGAKKGESG